MDRAGCSWGRTGRPVAAVGGALVVCALILAGCSGSASSPPAATGQVDAAALIAERCTRCHTTERIDLAEHDRAGWQATVDRMVARGARLDEAEKAAVVDFLAQRRPPNGTTQ